jgi:hypothetical protein
MIHAVASRERKRPEDISDRGELRSLTLPARRPRSHTNGRKFRPFLRRLQLRQVIVATGRTFSFQSLDCP